MLKIKKKFASNVVKSAIIKNSIKQILIRGRAIKKRCWGPCKVGCSLISFRGIYIAIDTSQSMESLNLSGLYLCTCSYNKWLHKSARIVNILEMSSRCVCKYSDSHVDTCIMPKLCMLLVSVDTLWTYFVSVEKCMCWPVLKRWMCPMLKPEMFTSDKTLSGFDKFLRAGPMDRCSQTDHTMTTNMKNKLKGIVVIFHSQSVHVLIEWVVHNQRYSARLVLL